MDTSTYIIGLLQPLHNELYTLDPEPIFVNSLDAVKEGTEGALRRILIEHSRGVFTFNTGCHTFSEVQNFSEK